MITNEKEYQEAADKLLERVPEQYHQGCKSLAWSLGHSSGYQEVYYYLQDIANTIFKEEK